MIVISSWGDKFFDIFEVNYSAYGIIKNPIHRSPYPDNKRPLEQRLIRRRLMLLHQEFPLHL